MGRAQSNPRTPIAHTIKSDMPSLWGGLAVNAANADRPNRQANPKVNENPGVSEFGLSTNIPTMEPMGKPAQRPASPRARLVPGALVGSSTAADWYGLVSVDAKALPSCYAAFNGRHASSDSPNLSPLVGIGVHGVLSLSATVFSDSSLKHNQRVQINVPVRARIAMISVETRRCSCPSKYVRCGSYPMAVRRANRR